MWWAQLYCPAGISRKVRQAERLTENHMPLEPQFTRSTGDLAMNTWISNSTRRKSRIRVRPMTPADRQSGCVDAAPNQWRRGPHVSRQVKRPPGKCITKSKKDARGGETATQQQSSSFAR